MKNLIFPWHRISIGTTLFCTLGYLMVFLPKDTFIFLAKEDGIIEWTGTFLFFVTAILFCCLFFRVSNFAKGEDANYYNSFTKRIWFLLLGLLFIFLVGEEISWGHRILGFETPTALEKRNMQNEPNLHNLDIFHLFDEKNERKKGLALHFTAKRIFIYIFTSYMLFLPLLVKFNSSIRQLIKKLHIPVPVIELGLMFLANVLLYISFKPLAAYDHKVGRALSEVQEMNFAVVLLFLPFVWYKVRSLTLSENRCQVYPETEIG